MEPKTMPSSEGGVWVRESRDWCRQCGAPATYADNHGLFCDAHTPQARRPVMFPSMTGSMDLRTPHDRLAAQVVELEGRIIELEQRLGSATDRVVCCHTRFGAPCIRWTTRANAEANWAYVGACYYCPQCWGHICAGR